jgi:3-ketosteroid 9alpha-monooxygenase subunit A
LLVLNMRPTGWFQIGWSAEIPLGGVKPMRYFGKELVAFRAGSGELAVLDAHCRHLGAHLGYESTVIGDCVVCPHHGWEWDTEGGNARIPYQEKPSRSRLHRWDIVERHGLILLWHDPEGGAPREGWLPDLFDDFPQFPMTEADYHPCFPNAIVDKPSEAIHPQLIQESTADSMHFRFTHGSPQDPQLLPFEADGPLWRSGIGFTSPRTNELTLTFTQINAGVGLTFGVFDGVKMYYRLVLTATPVDDETTDLRVSYFLPKLPSSPEMMTAAQRAFAEHTIELFEQDARIWRHQVFVQKPVFARQDVAAHSALRKWCEQFYESEGGASPTPMVAE